MHPAEAPPQRLWAPRHPPQSCADVLSDAGWLPPGLATSTGPAASRPAPVQAVPLRAEQRHTAADPSDDLSRSEDPDSDPETDSDSAAPFQQPDAPLVPVAAVKLEPVKPEPGIKPEPLEGRSSIAVKQEPGQGLAEVKPEAQVKVESDAQPPQASGVLPSRDAALAGLGSYGSDSD